MSDLRLLREGTSGSFDRALLESARQDRAPDGAEERALAALGLGAVAIAGAAVVSQGASMPPAAAAASKVAAATKVATALVLKWLGVGAVVVVAAAAPVTYLFAMRTPAPSDAVRPAASAAPVVQRSGPPPFAARRSGSLSPDDTTGTSGDADRAPHDELDDDTSQGAIGGASQVVPTLTSPLLLPSSPPLAAPPKTSSRAANGASHESAAPPARGESLSTELEVLDRARGALRGHDRLAARQALDEYARRFPQGSLREEAELASIELLVETGDKAAAREAAEAFLVAHPASPYAGRARAILKRVSNP